MIYKNYFDYYLEMNARVVNLKFFGTKAQTKFEMYLLLTVNCGLYLPPQREASIYFIRDIMEQRKRVMLFHY